MLRFIYFLALIFFFSDCSKPNSGYEKQVEIYLLRSFSRQLDTSRQVGLITIATPILEDDPLVKNSQILFYEQENTSFKLSRNFKPLLDALGANRGFAVTVDGKPVYYGTFHPASLSSIQYGTATINTSYMEDNKLKIDFALLDNLPFLESYDKRNDPLILEAFRASGRLR